MSSPSSGFGAAIGLGGFGEICALAKGAKMETVTKADGNHEREQWIETITVSM